MGQLRLLALQPGRSFNILAACAAGSVLGGLAALSSPLLALGVLVGLLALVLVAYRPELGLLAIVAVTCNLINPNGLPLIRLGPASLHLTDALLLYMLGLALLRLLLDPDFRLVRTPLDVPVLWLFGAILLAAARSILWYSLDVNFVLRMLRPLLYYLAFFAVTQLIRERRQLSLLIHGLMLIALISAVYMALQAVFPSLRPDGYMAPELATAGRTHAGVVRIFFQAERLIYAMLLVSLCLLALRVRPGSQAPTLLQTATLMAGLFVTFQRNYWATMLMMAALLCALITWPQRLRLLRWAALGLLVVAVLAALPGGGFDRYLAAAGERLIWGLQVRTLQQDDSAQWRVMENGYALETIGRQPLFGIGLANFYRPAKELDLYQRGIAPDIGLRWYIHNAYLWIWIDTGLLGLIPFIWLYAGAILRGLAGWRTLATPQERAVVLGFALALLGQAISNLVAPNFVQSWSLVVFSIIIAVNELLLRQPVSGERPVSCTAP